jgi:flagellar basal body L-ring protein FlgH
VKKIICAMFAALALTVTLTSCAQLVEGLRRDLDDDAPPMDSPTVGGRFPERGFLSDSGGDGSSSGRSPASARAGSQTGSSGSWANGDSARRDQQRGGDDGEDDTANSGNTPVMKPSTQRNYKNGSRATADDFIDSSPNEGSLWASGGQTNYYFTKNKIRGVGDIVTVTVEQELVRDIALEVRRGLTPRERDSEYALAQERIKQRMSGGQKDSVASSAAAPDRSPAAAGAQPAGGNKPYAATEATGSTDVEAPAPTLADIDLTQTLELKANDTMLGEVVERYSNGNYRIRATKRVPYKNGAPRMVTVTAVAKGTDFSEDDVIASGKLYEYKIEAVR